MRAFFQYLYQEHLIENNPADHLHPPKVEKKMPDEYINAAGNGVTQAFMDWCAPLIGEPLEKLISLRDDGISPF